MLRLYGAGLAAVGATAEVSSCPPPYEIPQELSRALHLAFPQISGIDYRSRHDNDKIADAIFDTAPNLRELSRNEELNTDAFWKLAERYNVGMAP